MLQPINLIEEKMSKIFSHRFQTDLSQIHRKDYLKSFFNPPFHLSPRDLIYLFFDIEKEFSITIPEKDIVSGKFSNLMHVIDLVNEQLNLQGECST